MAYLKPSEYKGNKHKFPFPSSISHRGEKAKEEYFLKFMQAFYADYANDGCEIPSEFSNNRSIRELRAYAKGKQSSSKIKSWVLGKRNKNNDGTYNTKMNVSWDTYAKLPQMFDIMRSKNMSHEYDIDLTCVDNDSIASIEATRGMMKFFLDDNTKKFMERAMYKGNMEPDPESLGLQNEEDVDMYIDTGGFTLQWQMAAEAAFRKSKIVSNYKVFQDAIMDDLIINPEGVCGVRTYIEKSTGLPKFRRINMERAIVPKSDLNDFSDITMAAELRVMSIADLRTEYPHLKPIQLLQIAKNFAWMNTGLDTVIGAMGHYGASANFDSSYDLDPISRAKVIVMDAQWLSIDIDLYLKNDNRNFFKQIDPDFKLTAKSSKDGDRKIEKKTIRKYESQWIVGTEFILKGEQCEDTIYYGDDGNKTPKLDLFFAKTGNMSLVERCVAIVDDMDMIMVKHRNAWATLPAAPAMAIQKDLIENVMLNGILQQPEDIMQTLIEKGILYYNGLDDFGKPLYMAGGQKPIDYMDVGKMVQMLVVCSQEMAVKVNELREVLGLQGGADGGEKDRYQGLGETQTAIEMSNASLQPTFNAYHYLFRNFSDDIIKKWQIVAKGRKVKVSHSILGNKNLKILELGKNFTAAEFNVDVKIAPSIQERQALLGEILQLKQLGSTTDGAQGLTTSEYMYVYERIMAGNIKEAYFVMAKIEAKKRSEARMQQMQDQEYNIKSQQESAKVKGDLDKENIREKGKVQNENSVIAALLKQNQAMLEALVKPQKEGESTPNEGLAMATIDSNLQDIAEVMIDEEEQSAMQSEGDMMPQEEDMMV